MADFKFPLDNQDDYKGTITFSFYQVVLEANIGGLIGAIGDFFTSSDEESSPNITDEAAGSTISREISTVLSTIELYLPPSLNFQDGINYDNMVDLGAVGGAVAGGLEATGTLSGQQVYSAITSSFESIYDFALNGATADTARIMAMRASRLGGQTTRDVVSTALRIAPNPNRRTLFRSVRPREFTFNFKMIANSEREALEIDRILKEFRVRMYPDVATPVEGEEGLLNGEFIAFNYPDMVQVELKYNERQVGSRIQRGFITALNTTYNPSSMGYHIDGKPSEVDVSVSIFEERALDRRDIEVGY